MVNAFSGRNNVCYEKYSKCAVSNEKDKMFYDISMHFHLIARMTGLTMTAVKRGRYLMK